MLDLGGRSKLINYKHSTTSSRSKKQSFLRIVDEIPELIIEKLDKEGIMKAAKAHRFYDKPSVRKRAKSKAALKYKIKKGR